jgi:hypothetical protein
MDHLVNLGLFMHMVVVAVGMAFRQIQVVIFLMV